MLICALSIPTTQNLNYPATDVSAIIIIMFINTVWFWYWWSWIPCICRINQNKTVYVSQQIIKKKWEAMAKRGYALCILIVVGKKDF